MSNDHSKRFAPQARQQLVDLADELNEVLELNYFLYDAVEGIVGETARNDGHNPTYQTGLSLFLRHLRQRDHAIKTQLRQIRAI